MDLALNLYAYNSTSEKLLICLDADCTVSENYLTEIIDSFNKNNYSAAVVKYEHPLNENDKNIYAIICYEIFLRYYVLGLIYAESPYAIHTVGSTMICDFESYIKIEGMNKKRAAEDFYFLEKLAKHYEIHNIKTTTVYPSSRSSWRVPFGTGQRVGRFLTGSQNEYLLYDPASFTVLKKWLNLLSNNQNISLESLLINAQGINSELYNFLINQNFQKSWENILNHTKNDGQLILQKKRWFDGFRTLKLIHHLRDTVFPLINMFDALDKMLQNFDNIVLPKRMNGNIPDLQIQKEYLRILRELT